MIQVRTGTTFDAVLEGAPSGLVGTLGVRVVDPTTGTTPVARTTSGITEFPAGSGVYGVTLTAPALGANSSPWAVSVLWDTGEPLAPGGVFTEDLLVYEGPPPVSNPGVDTPYFTVEEFRDRYSDVLEADYPDAQVEAVRALAEQTIEDATNTAWVNRTRTDAVHAFGNRRALLLPYGPVVSVDAATDYLGGAVDVSGVDVDGSSVALSWPSRAITVTYTYGHSAPPLRVKQAAMILTRAWLVRGPTDDRETQRSNPDGSVINLATPGLLGATVGIPEVDAVIEQYRLVSV